MKKSPRQLDIIELSLNDTAVEFSSEGDERKFTMRAYSSQVVDHPWYGAMVFETAGFTMAKDVIPALFEHDGKQVVGEITSMSNNDGQIVFFGNFIDTPEAQKLLKSKNLKYECSLAFPMSKAEFTEVADGESVTINNSNFTGPIRAIHSAPVHECSFAHYGAVAGTSTNFSNTFSNKENDMPEPGKGGNAPTPQISERDVFNQMVQLSGGDTAFAAECFGQGIGVDQFKEKIIVKLSEEKKSLSESNVKLTSQVEELKNEVLELKKQMDDSVHGHGPGKPPEKDFTTLSKEYAAEKSVSLDVAMTIIAEKHPEAYQAITGRG